MNLKQLKERKVELLNSMKDLTENVEIFNNVQFEEMKAELLSKIEECDGYVGRLIPPPKPDDVPKKSCNYCNYKSACRKAGK